MFPGWKQASGESSDYGTDDFGANAVSGDGGDLVGGFGSHIDGDIVLGG